MTQGIKDKVIVITGANDRPGEACICHLARHRRATYHICFDDVRGCHDKRKIVSRSIAFCVPGH
jgi:NAD(P)-dependent dehydrogenase (short-subunit alcohol dehydrogenase family)